MTAFFSENLTGVNMGNLGCCIAFNVIILIAVLMRRDRPMYSKMYASFLICMIGATAFEMMNYILLGNPAVRVLFICTNCATFIAQTLAGASFLFYLLYYSEYRYDQKIDHRLIKGLFIYVVLCVLIYISSIWTGWIFTVTEDSYYVLMPYAFATGLMNVIFMIMVACVVLRNIRKAPVVETILYLGFIAMFGVAGLLDAMLLTTIYFTSMTVFAGLIFILVDIEQQKNLAMKQREILLSELKALRLQMNPHYIYNTLASIDGLIIFDPDAARVMIGKFIKHLRGSYLNDMPMMIPVKDEIQNLKYYIDVEKMRFPDIEVVFDMQVDDFEIPPLVIQPLLENAIKHGICQREDSSGQVIISSYEDVSSYRIKIIDNGVGFDMSHDFSQDGRQHIGINNTKKRLELICQGELRMNSIVGVGTEAEIIIPKR